MTKYDAVETRVLVIAIQKSARKLEDPEEKKKLSTTERENITVSLRGMRNAVIPRLMAMDRTLCSFFPMNSFVTHSKKPQEIAFDDFSEAATEPPKHGIVYGAKDDRLIVEFEGENFFTLMRPADLTLKYIR